MNAAADHAMTAAEMAAGGAAGHSAQPAFLSLALGIGLVLLAAALVLTVLRLIKGPTVCDRAVAVDLLTLVVLGITAILMIHTDKPLWMSLLTVMALVSFLGTVAFAYYVGQKGVKA
jgi:multicomponent Na+:H+ antiporter subunit F